jgi:hypothetical protein
MEIYFNTRYYTRQLAEQKIAEISDSAAQSIEMGYPCPREHGGFMFTAENGYIAITGGGVLYGFIDRSEGGGSQSCALMGFTREGSITKQLLPEDGWNKTSALDWVVLLKNALETSEILTSLTLRAPDPRDYTALI